MKRLTMSPKILACAISAVAAMPVFAEPSTPDLDFYGYYRTNVGTSNDGGDQMCYKAAGARAKYRLGNECDNYYEAGVKGELFNQNGRTFRVQTMLGGSDTSESGIGLIQAAVMGDNVIDALPGATLWAGKLYYQRHAVAMNDFFYWNASGNAGAGIEKISLGSDAKLAVAWIENNSGAAGDVHNNNIDVRVSNIGIAGGALEVGATYAAPNLTDDQEAMGVADNNGSLISLEYGFAGNTDDAYNKVVLQFGNDGMAGSTGVNDNTMEGSSVRAIAFGLVDLADNLESEYNVLYDTVEDAAGNTTTWTSVGVRPVMHWNDVASTALEIGHDSVTSDTIADNKLTKITLAQQWAAGDGYWARPLVRAYVTHAKGGQIALGNGNTAGTSLGVQAEVWW